MVIETRQGPDVLAGEEPWKNLIPQIPPGEVRKVWLAESRPDDSCCIEGHYLYIYPQEESDAERLYQIGAKITKLLGD